MQKYRKSLEGIFQTTLRLPLENTDIIKMGERETGIFKISIMFSFFYITMFSVKLKIHFLKINETLYTFSTLL